MVATGFFKGLSALFGSVLLFIVLGSLTGVLSRSRVSAFQYWSIHPWRFFYLFDALILLLVFLTLGLKLAESITFVFFVPLLLLMIISAIQGLRVSWLRSRVRATVIILIAFGILLIPQLIDEPLLAIISSTLAILIWMFSAWVANNVGKSKIVRQKTTRKVLKKNIKEAGEKINKLFANKNVKLTCILIACFILLAGIGLYLIPKIVEESKVQRSYWGLTLDMTKKDVLFFKGTPENKDEYFWTYHDRDDRYPSISHRYWIAFQSSDDKIVFIGGTGSPIRNIAYGDSYEKVIKTFGKPSYISRSKDDLVRILSFEKYNVYVELEKGQVQELGIYNPTLIEALRFGNEGEQNNKSNQ